MAPAGTGSGRAPVLSSPHFANFGSAYGSAAIKYLRRVGGGIDLEYLAYQFIYATFAPSKVYKLTTLRKQTKNQWARDEPSFALLTLVFVAASSVSWGITFGVPFSSPMSYAWLIAQSWLRFLVLGLTLTTACWAFANRSRTSSLPYSTVTGGVEFAYAWDCHCNGYTVVLWTLHVAQLLLAPVLLGSGWTATLACNTLHLLAFVEYWYIVHLGYATLPYLKTPAAFLAPAGVALIVLALCTVLNMNMGRLLLGTYIE